MIDYIQEKPLIDNTFFSASAIASIVIINAKKGTIRISIQREKVYTPMIN